MLLFVVCMFIFCELPGLLVYFIEVIKSKSFSFRSFSPRFGGHYTLSFLHAGLGIPQLLEAILKLFPLDTYVTSPVLDLTGIFFVRVTQSTSL